MCYLAEPLEPRLLLTFIVNGTNSADNIVIGYDGQTVVVVNGAVQSSGDINVVLNAMGGNDTISVVNTSKSFVIPDAININCGSGDDTVTVGSGNFGSDIGAFVGVHGDAGNDLLTINDSVDGDSIHDTMYFDNFGIASDTDIYVDGEVGFNDVESTVINRSDQNDVVDIRNTLGPGVTLNLGNGTNTVHFGDDNHRVHGVADGPVDEMTINGGIHFDTVVFDDANSPFNTQYGIASNGTFGQSLSAIDEIDYAGGPASTCNLTGTAGASSITFNGVAQVNVGLNVLPLDIDSLNATVTGNMGALNFFDNDIDNSANPYVLWETSSTTQHIQKGSFHVVLSSANEQLQIHVSGHQTVYNVAGVTFNSNITIHSSGQGDLLQTVNAGGNNNGGNLFSLFTGSSFTYEATPADFAILDDSAAPIGAGNSNYGLLETAVGEDFFKDAATLHFVCHRAKFALLADDGDNTITAVSSESGMSIDSGDGNDLIRNFDTSHPHDIAATGLLNVTGGVGNDTLWLNDQDGAVSDYRFDDGQFGYDTHSTAIDPSIENFILDEDNLAATSEINAIHPPLHLTVNGGGGNDTFTVGGEDIDSNGMDNLVIDGGTGTNSVEFDDHLDPFNPSEVETTNLNDGELVKGAINIEYSNIQSQQFNASSVGNGTVQNGQFVNLNATSIPTTIIGCFNRYCVINVAQGNLVTIGAPVMLTMGGVGGAVINDQSSPGDKNYVVTSTQFSTSLNQIVNFSGSGITLHANAGNNLIFADTASAVEPDFIDAGGGNDEIFVGNGNIDQDLLAPIAVEGGSGNDTVDFDNSGDPSLESQALSSASLVDGQTHSFTHVESVELFTGSGGGTVSVPDTSVNTIIHGGSGPDTVNIGAGHIEANLHGAITVNGGGGTDSVLLDDHLNTAATGFMFDAGDIFRGFVDCNGVENETFQGGFGDDTVTVNSVSLDLSVFTNAGNDTVVVKDSDTFVNVDTGSENPDVSNNFGDNLIINDDASAPNDVAALVRLNPGSHDTLRGLRISSFPGGTVGVCQIPANTTMVIPDAFNPISLNGIIDMAGGSFVYHGAGVQQTTFFGFLKNGYSNGSWDGYSAGQDVINSSLAHQTALRDAVGYAPASSVFTSFPASFGGVSVDSSDLLIGYTLDGDANLDGIVNALDFNALASNFGINSFVNWNQGNFNYDFSVNSQDFTAIAMNFNQTAPLPAPSALDSSTPPVAHVSSSVLTDLFSKDEITSPADDLL